MKLFFYFCSLLLSLFTYLPIITQAREVTGPIKLNKDSCWDLGFVDYISSAGECQLRCTFTEGCNSWSYAHSGLYRCHLCSWMRPRAAVTCDNAGSSSSKPCKTWGLKGDSTSLNPTKILNDGIEKANGVCQGNLKGEEALYVAQELNLIISKYVKGDFDEDGTFMSNLDQAATNASMVIRRETLACRRQYTSPIQTCQYGSLVLHQLRALILNVFDDSNAAALKAFPRRFNIGRRRLFKRYKVFLADNGWLSENSVAKIDKFYADLPSFILSEGILYDAPYATQTVLDAWKCKGKSPGNLGTTNRGYNVFKIQVGWSFEQAFPGDTPNLPSPFDLQLTVTRHEVAHQFDRIIANRAWNDGDSRLNDLFQKLKQASVGDDESWLRSQVGDEYFQNSPQEIIASQIGNQYLASTSSQLRLAASRFEQSNVEGTLVTYQKVESGVATLTRENKECANQIKYLGVFETAQECVDAIMMDSSCSHEIMYSNTYPSWGCRCCESYDADECTTEEYAYASHDLWDIYQFENYEGNTLESSDKCSKGNGVPLSWFVFNVDLFTPVSELITTMYENEVNGQVTKVEALVERDSASRIVGLDTPFCGKIDFEYDDNGIVNAVSPNAAECNFQCVDDANWVITKFERDWPCSWVTGNLNARCNMIGKDGRKAKHVCLKSCNMCS